MPYPQVEATNTSLEDPATNTHTVSLPAGIQAGETLLVFFAVDLNMAVGWPGGWNEILELQDGNITLAIAWRKATGGEGGTITVTTSGSRESTHASYRISGATDPTVTPPEVSTGVAGTSNVPNPDSLTASGGSKQYLWIAVAMCDGFQNFTGYPYPDNRRTITNSDDAGCAVAVCSDEVETDTQDPGNFTISGSDHWIAATVAVYPEAEEPGGLENKSANMGSKMVVAGVI